MSPFGGTWGSIPSGDNRHVLCLYPFQFAEHFTASSQLMSLSKLLLYYLIMCPPSPHLLQHKFCKGTNFVLFTPVLSGLGLCLLVTDTQRMLVRSLDSVESSCPLSEETETQTVLSGVLQLVMVDWGFKLFLYVCLAFYPVAYFIIPVAFPDTHCIFSMTCKNTDHKK